MIPSLPPDFAARALSAKLWVLDLDGVVYRGKELVPGAAEAIELSRAGGSRVVFLTNNATKTREMYVDLLSGFGIEAVAEDVFTSAWITARWLEEHARSEHRMPPDVHVFVIGEIGIKTDLATAGFVIHDDDEYGIDPSLYSRTDHVVVALDRDVTYQKLFVGLNCLRQGATLVATNDDTAIPIEGGFLSPGAGSILAALETCAERKPDFGSPFGKPNPIVYELIESATGIEPGDIIAVGDRLETDILSANRAGITSVLVLTGVTTENDLPSETAVPDFILPSIASLIDLFTTTA
jgi:phosphoglycolate/pyridoxal phosphate phosphatase family enzyme